MNVALIGATGGTGRHFITLATAGQHSVTALARDPAKLEGIPDSVTRVRADGRDVGSLVSAMNEDIDVIVSIVGASGLLEARKVQDLYSESTKNLVQAAQRLGIPRLVVVSSAGVEPQANDGWFYVHILKRFFLEAMYQDMRRMETVVQKSRLDWTIVRPPYLSDGAATGNYRVRKDSNFDDDRSLRRGDLAHFLLRVVVEHPEYSRSVVRITE
jgi:putative NADH-flavin reductase